MKKLKEITTLLGGEMKGDPDLLISGVHSIEKAGKDEISFLAKQGFDIQRIRAGALIVARDTDIEYPNLVFVDSPYLAFARLLEYFFPHQPFSTGISPQSSVAESARLGSQVAVGPFVHIGDRTSVGDHCEIHSGTVIYHDVKIGKNCIIYANAVIREGVEIGDNCIVHAGAVIGADGFGFTRTGDGTPIKIPQKGKVVIGSHCEIGANTCIDRSTIEETRLHDHVKLDNLVQVGHNTKIGAGTTISALTGISGSVKIGKNVIMGGQVGIADHLEITDGVIIAGKTGVSGHIKKRSIIAGNPHLDIRRWRRLHSRLRNLDENLERISSLEKKVKELEEK